MHDRMLILHPCGHRACIQSHLPTPPVSSSKLVPQARGFLRVGHLLLHWEPTTDLAAQITRAVHRWKGLGQSLRSWPHRREGLSSIYKLNP